MLHIFEGGRQVPLEEHFSVVVGITIELASWIGEAAMDRMPNCAPNWGVDLYTYICEPGM